MSDIKKQWIILAVLLYITFVCLMHKWGFHGDMLFWLNWSKYIFNNGFTSIYDNPNCNYLPAYLYFLLLHVKLQGNLIDIQDNLYTIKYYTLIFDLLGAFLAVWFVRNETKKIFYFLILLFNIAYIYNTAFWAQVDAIYTFFGFAAIVLSLEKRPILSSLSLLLALNFKLQALVFIPVVGLILLPQFFKKDAIKKIAVTLILAVIIQTIILLPFILTHRLYQVMNVIVNAIDFYPYTSVGAYNIWVLLLPDTVNDIVVNDGTRFKFLTYKQIGNCMFCIATIISLFPLIKYIYIKYVSIKAITFELDKVFLIAALTALNFYFFNTQMHERYAHPAIISLAAYSFCSRRFFPFILGSVAYFLNMEGVCWYFAFHINTYKHFILFRPEFVAVLYLILILTSFYLLYNNKNNIEEQLILI